MRLSRVSMRLRSLMASSRFIASMSRSGSTEPFMWNTAGSSNARTTWQKASMSFNLLSHCSRGFGSCGGAGASVHSISAYFVFFGWYIAESLSMRWSATLTVPMWYSVARASKWSTPTPVSREKTVFLPTCGRPIRAMFIKKNSKYEIRNPKKIRNSNYQTTQMDALDISSFEIVSHFDIRISDLGFEALTKRLDAVETLLDVLHCTAVP